jgi:hypothetical protein
MSEIKKAAGLPGDDVSGIGAVGQFALLGGVARGGLKSQKIAKAVVANTRVNR